jgi:hypothetical protein
VWAKEHPVALAGMMPEIIVMLYGKRDVREANVIVPR